MEAKEYLPQEFFSGVSDSKGSPRVIIAPHRYIQGNGVLDNLGCYMSGLGFQNPALLITEGGIRRIGERVSESLRMAGLEPVILFFHDECSDQEIERIMEQLKGDPVDSVIAAGGGKCLDAGKCVAHTISVPVIICPTVASTDAPCSACAVMYTPEGAFDRPWFFPESPTMVLVDTGVIIQAPLRFLVAGMGDAMSTYYEAKTCFLNPRALTMIGARPTAMALAVAEIGAKLLFENGVAAVEAAKRVEVNEAVENVIEANTLLSGIGFESGGLAASHGFAQVLPVIPFLHDRYMHGEMVAMGVLVQRCLEGEEEDAVRVGSFFAKVGLPVHMGQLSLAIDQNNKEIKMIIDEAMNVFFMHHEPFEVTSDKLMQSLLKADSIGKEISQNIGDTAYRILHPEYGI